MRANIQAMKPLTILLASVACAGLISDGAPAGAQVEVTPLAALDLFSTGYGDTGLGQDVWHGASAALARSVLTRLAERPVSPAARGLAVRLLSTGGAAPRGAGADAELAAARARALIALGQPQAVAVILNRTPNIGQSPALSRAAAEAFLRTGHDDQACEVADGLGAGREAVYWLRLRAYCQAVAGNADEAALTFGLANQTERDPVYARLMGAVLAGSGKPGAASYRDGLDMALSRRLGLPPAPDPVLPDVVSAEAIAALEPLLAAAGGGDRAAFDAVFDQVAAASTPAVKARAQTRVLLLQALGASLSDPQRALVVSFEAGRGSATAGALLALGEAATAGEKGQTALAALSICVAAPATGLAQADRISIVAALRRAGLAADARAFAIEGLAALR